jgi:hypothetical protein
MLNYCHKQLEPLADFIVLTLKHNKNVFHVDLCQKTYKEQDNKTFNVNIPTDNTMAESLELTFYFSECNIQKLMQHLIGNQLEPMINVKDWI